MLLTAVSGSKMRITIFSPKAVGSVDRRISTSAPMLSAVSGRLVLMRPSSGRRLLDHVHAAEQLDARGHRVHHAQRHLVDGVQHAVDAEADGAHVAPRLEVDVAGALVEGVLPQPVDHLHHALVVGVELLVASCPARPVARSWPRPRPRRSSAPRAPTWPARRTRSCTCARPAGWPAPACTRAPRVRLDLGRPSRCRRARWWRSTTSLLFTCTGSARRLSA